MSTGANEILCRNLVFNRLVKCVVAISLVAAVSGSRTSGQAAPQSSGQSPTSATGSMQEQSAAPTSTAQKQAESSAPATTAKKPKKVWTNDDVASGHDPEPPAPKSLKDSPKKADPSKPSSQHVANIRKELEKLQAQLKDTNQQISDLKAFLAGKPAPGPGGYQLGKGYNRMPVDQQIAKLEDKKKQIQAKIDDLLDEARKNGIEPGQLR